MIASAVNYFMVVLLVTLVLVLPTPIVVIMSDFLVRMMLSAVVLIAPAPVMIATTDFAMPVLPPIVMVISANEIFFEYNASNEVKPAFELECLFEFLLIN